MKFNASEIDNYAQDSVGYFSLKDDGDSCRVRIMYEGVGDVEGYCTHRVRLRDGSYRNVNCLREYNDPLDVCPICNCKDEEAKKTKTSIWIPIYKEDTSECVLWQKGANFYKKVLYPLMATKGEPFCGHTFEIVRHGVAGDVNTTYEFIDCGVDDTTLDDFDEIPDPMGSLILDKSFDELTTFVKTGSFDTDDDEIPEIPRRRGTASDEAPELPRRRGTARPNTEV